MNRSLGLNTENYRVENTEPLIGCKRIIQSFTSTENHPSQGKPDRKQALLTEQSHVNSNTWENNRNSEPLSGPRLFRIGLAAQPCPVVHFFCLQSLLCDRQHCSADASRRIRNQCASAANSAAEIALI